MSKQTIAIIVLNWHGASDTIACIESLMQLSTQNVGIFVCDNASTDNSIALIRSWSNGILMELNAERKKQGRQTFSFLDLADSPVSELEKNAPADPCISSITLIQTGSNGGYAAGNNIGLRIALAQGFDYFWILNNDTEVDPEAIFWLVNKMRSDTTIGICGSTVIYHSHRNMVQNLGGAKFVRLKGRGVQLGSKQKPSDLIDEREVESNLSYICGAAMFVSRAFLDKIGLMQEDYFLYWEEIDWAARATGKFRLGYASRSVVYHKVGASIGTNDFGERSPLSDYYMGRNRLKFCWRFSRISIPFVLADISRSAIRWAVRGKWRRSVILIRAIFGLPYVK